MKTMTVKNQNYCNAKADDVMRFEQEHIFKYYFCLAYDETDFLVSFMGVPETETSVIHYHFHLASDEIEKYYQIHEHNYELDTAYAEYKKIINKAA